MNMPPPRRKANVPDHIKPYKIILRRLVTLLVSGYFLTTEWKHIASLATKNIKRLTVPESLLEIVLGPTNNQAEVCFSEALDANVLLILLFPLNRVDQRCH